MGNGDRVGFVGATGKLLHTWASLLETCLAVIGHPAQRPLASFTAFLGLLKHAGQGPFL